MLRRLSGGAVVIAAAGGGYMLATDEGSRRSLVFWSNIFPIYLHYRGIQLLNRDLGVISDSYADRLYADCNERYTYRVRDITYSMRGFYLKQAQLLSTRDEFVPKEYMRWVKDTQDNVPSELKPGEARRYVAKLLKEELNLDFDDVFEDWEDDALGIGTLQFAKHI